jgi:hypothetical protein
MRRFYENNRFLLIALPVLFVAMSWEYISWHRLNPEHEAQRIYDVLQVKENHMERTLNSIIQEIKYTKSLESTWYLLNPRKYNWEDRAITISRSNYLLYWTSSLVAFPIDDSSITTTNEMVHLPTGWFWMITKSEGGYVFKGFILIKRDYPYRNKYIQDSFQKDFNLPGDYEVSIAARPGAINIQRPNGDFLFSIIPIKKAINQKSVIILFVLYFIVLLLILAQINQFLLTNHKLRPVYKFIISPF